MVGNKRHFAWILSETVLSKNFEDRASLDDLIEYSPIQVDSSQKSVELLNKIADGTYWQDIVTDFNTGQIDGYQAEERLSTCYKQQLQKRYTYVLDMPIQIKRTNHPEV